MNVPRKYAVLRAIALLLKILAVIALLAGIVVAVFAVNKAAGAQGAMAGVIQALGSAGMVMGPMVGIIWFVQLYAFGSILSLLVQIEENTRALAAQPPVQLTTTPQA